MLIISRFVLYRSHGKKCYPYSIFFMFPGSCTDSRSTLGGYCSTKTLSTSMSWANFNTKNRTIHFSYWNKVEHLQRQLKCLQRQLQHSTQACCRWVLFSVPVIFMRKCKHKFQLWFESKFCLAYLWLSCDFWVKLLQFAQIQFQGMETGLQSRGIITHTHRHLHHLYLNHQPHTTP